MVWRGLARCGCGFSEAPAAICFGFFMISRAVGGLPTSESVDLGLPHGPPYGLGGPEASNALLLKVNLSLPGSRGGRRPPGEEGGFFCFADTGMVSRVVFRMVSVIVSPMVPLMPPSWSTNKLFMVFRRQGCTFSWVFFSKAFDETFNYTDCIFPAHVRGGVP